MPWCRAVLAAAILAIPMAFPAAAAPWIRVESRHFIVSGNVTEKEARDVASRLEQFREVLVRIFPVRLAMRPLPVVAFDSEHAYRPYKPLYDGKPAPVGGYFVWNSDGACITLRLDRGEESYPIIFHEYAHLFLAQSSRSLASWLSEGLAEYYSTVEVISGGRQANIGRPVVRHLRLLQYGHMDLKELLSVTQASKIWSKQEDAALFYAQSWALVHYLSSAPDGPARLLTLVEKLQRGVAELEAFEQVFGRISEVQGALRQYVQGAAYGYSRYDFPTKVNAERAPARPLAAPEVDATLATVLVYLGRFDEAAGRVEAALNASPGLAEAHVARGLLERRRGATSAAESALRTAVEKAPGNIEAAYHWGLSLLELRDRGSADLERAVAALSAALPAEEPPAEALMVLGVLQGLTGRMKEGEASLRRSMQLAPGQTRTIVGLAELLARQERFAEARALLEPMAARPGYAGQRDVANSQLQWIAQMEDSARRRENLARGAKGGRSENTQPAGSDGESLDRATGGVIPVYRTLGPGEAREEGTLEQIECTRQGLVLHLAASSGKMRYWAPRFEEVEFITYRKDLAGSVGCGLRKPLDHVWLTWRAIPDREAPAAAGKLSGRAVAVEFLGDKR